MRKNFFPLILALCLAGCSNATENDLCITNENFDNADFEALISSEAASDVDSGEIITGQILAKNIYDEQAAFDNSVEYYEYNGKAYWFDPEYMPTVFIESDGKYIPVVGELTDWKTVSEAQEDCATVGLMMNLNWQDYNFVGSCETGNRTKYFYLKNDGTLMLVTQYVSEPEIDLSEGEKLVAAAFLVPSQAAKE